MKTLFTLFLLLSLGSVTAAPKPNIVFIFIDDMGWGDLTCSCTGRQPVQA